MNSGLPRILISFGAILISFGITFGIIELLAMRYGTPHPLGGMLAIIALIGGAILAGGGTAMNRSRSDRAS